MITRRAIAGAVAVLSLFGTLPSSAQEQGAPQIEEVPAAILKLLDDHGRAWLTHDDALLRATLADRLVESQVRALANATDVDFTSVTYEAVTQFSGNLASPRVRRAYPGREVLNYQVTERTKIGNETQEFHEDASFTFTRNEPVSGDPYDGWRLTSTTDLDALGFFSPHHLWDEAKVAVLRSDRFTLLTHPDVADQMQAVLDITEDAFDVALEFWPRQAPERYVIIAPSTTEELGRVIHETVDLDKFVAFVAAGVERDAGWEPTGARMFVHLDHLLGYGPEAQTNILAHELIHAVTRPVAGPHMTAWVEEGLANHGAGGAPSNARNAEVGDVFPTDDRFVTGPVAGIQAVYDQAQVAIQVLDEERGREGLAAFYEKLGAARIVAGNDEYHVRAAIGEAGWSYDEWVAAWRKKLG